MTINRRRPTAFAWSAPETPPAPAREPLTRSQIVSVAIRLIDAEGLEAFSMRRLGQELGAGATSLYWHVKSKEQLIDLVLDELIGEVLTEVPRVDGWRAQLAEIAQALRRVLVRHRNVAPLLGERPTIGPNSLDAAEYTLRTMVEAGFTERSAWTATGALVNYAAGFALLESRGPRGGSDTPEGQAMRQAITDYFAALPADRYPNMIRVMRLQVSEEEQFEYGLERLLDGIELARSREAARAD